MLYCVEIGYLKILLYLYYTPIINFTFITNNKNNIYNTKTKRKQYLHLILYGYIKFYKLSHNLEIHEP